MRKTVVCWNVQPFQSNFGADLFKMSILRPRFRSVLIWTHSLSTGPVEQADVFCLHLISLQSYVPSERLEEPAGMKLQLGGQSPNVQLQYEKQSVSKKKTTTHNTSTKLGRGSQRASSPSDLLIFPLAAASLSKCLAHFKSQSYAASVYLMCPASVCVRALQSELYPAPAVFACLAHA